MTTQYRRARAAHTRTKKKERCNSSKLLSTDRLTGGLVAAQYPDWALSARFRPERAYSRSNIQGFLAIAIRSLACSLAVPSLGAGANRNGSEQQLNCSATRQTGMFAYFSNNPFPIPAHRPGLLLRAHWLDRRASLLRYEVAFTNLL